MIDWEELESPKDMPQAPQSDPASQSDVIASTLSLSAVAHWRRNLERFPSGHIGHEYAKQALAKLSTLFPTDGAKTID